MIKYNNSFLIKLEEMFKDGGYKIRYEKGNFKSGYCRLEERKVIVVNKFVSVETKVNCFMEILKDCSLNESTLSDQSRELYQKCKSDDLCSKTK